MWDWTVFFTNLPATILAASTLVGIILNWHKTRKVEAKVEKIEHQTNSLTEQLVDETRKGAFAAGKKSEADKAIPRNPHLGGS